VSVVDIPEEAMDVAWRAFSESLSQADSHLDYVAALADAITVAAPLIVAAELRRMADEVEAAETDSMWGRRELRYRADELDPTGGGVS
jgi:hypothetical protein